MCPQQQPVAQLIGGDGAVPGEEQALDPYLGAFVHGEDDVLGAVARDHAALGHLSRRIKVAHRAPGTGIVGDHRLAVTGRLGDPDVARDHRLEHEFREVRTDLSLDVLCQPRPAVVHREHHASHGQLRVHLALDE